MKASASVFIVREYDLGQNEPFFLEFFFSFLFCFFHWVSFNLDYFQNLLHDGVSKYLYHYIEDNSTEEGG